MRTPAPSVPAQLEAARRAVARAEAALRHVHLEQLPLSELRARHAALGAALDAAVAAAAAVGAGHRDELHRLRTQRELHTLAGLSTPGIRVATCPRASSRSAFGPLIAGMDFDPAPAMGPVDTRTYGLDLTACVDHRSGGDVLDRTALAGATALPEQRPVVRDAVAVAS